MNTHLGRCGTCAWTMRPSRTTLAQHPNTRTYRRPGICTICHAHALSAPAATFDLDHAVLALNYWLQDRRRRGVPEHGVDIGV
ncbi:hypothetical protein [Arthrobacter sp. ISL-69]|uniref:hypothetical protein n=1 Tax=Arthrobacter sp. ISL-69 TaxID=2819113 RepID=UPI001BECB8B2|nr:hypothetical protein [Arthrobacter sp. ISL-69]MBT2537254.1 hypothetical protein [Arthrobacter sp. ISL-69]